MRFLRLAAVAVALAGVGGAHAGDYAAARAEASRTGKPFVVGVGCAPPAGDWLIAVAAGLEGARAPCIVVSRDGVEWTATLGPAATAEDVRSWLPRKVETRRPAKKWNPYDVPNFQKRMSR